MDGYSGCVFCYGQTGSGKTFTMHGNRKTSPGLVPLSVETAFSYIEETPDKEFLLRVSYIEVYNECINDLLAPNKVNLKLQSDARKGIVVEGVTEEICTSAEKVYSLLMMGDTNKQISSTNFNLRSSRSHSL
jgi:centromeric protein E